MKLLSDLANAHVHAGEHGSVKKVSLLSPFVCFNGGVGVVLPYI